jgi:hypothetical protein
MDLTVHIPDDLVAQLGGEAVHDQLERRVLEAFALEEYKADRITKFQLRKMLGLERMELDGFLKAHDVTHDLFTLEEINQQVAALERLGI